MSGYPPFEPKQVICDNYKDSINTVDIVGKFRALYSALNAWLNIHSSGCYERDKINWLKNKNEVKLVFENNVKNDSRFRQRLLLLTNIRVVDMRESPEEPILLRDINDYKTVIEIIYRVRCNLVHGRKSTSYSLDRKLIEITYFLLNKIFTPIVKKICE